MHHEPERLMSYKVLLSSSIELCKMMYIKIDVGNVIKKINRTLNAEIPKKSAMPPQIPNMDLCLVDFLSFFN